MPWDLQTLPLFCLGALVLECNIKKQFWKTRKKKKTKRPAAPKISLFQDEIPKISRFFSLEAVILF